MSRPDDLLKLAHLAGLTEIEMMNALQDNGIISDLCVMSEDIATADLPAAMKWIESNY